MADARLNISVTPQVDFTAMIRQLRAAADALEMLQQTGQDSTRFSSRIESADWTAGYAAGVAESATNEQARGHQR